jgi:5-methylcytosine-specific restriction protein A
MPAQPIQSKNPTWSRDELILALDLYAHFKGNPPGKSTSEVVELSGLLNEMGAQIANRASDFRNANGVYMKVMNFRLLERKGCGRADNSETHGSSSYWDDGTIL